MISVKVIHSPDPAIIRVRPDADDDWVGIIPASFFPRIWKADRPEIGTNLKVRVVEFTPEDVAKDRPLRLILDAMNALPNPYKNLRSWIGRAATIEVMKVCPEKGLLVCLSAKPHVIGRIFLEDITVARPLEGHKYQAQILDVDEARQTIELSMRGAVKLHQKGRGKAA